MYTSIRCNLRVLEVLHRPDVKDIGVKKHALCQRDYRIRSFLSIRHSHGVLWKHLGTDSSIDLDDLDRLVSDHTTQIFKVSKGAKIRNRYNQVPHLTQDTNSLSKTASPSLYLKWT